MDSRILQHYSPDIVVEAIGLEDSSSNDDRFRLEFSEMIQDAVVVLAEHNLSQFRGDQSVANITEDNLFENPSWSSFTILQQNRSSIRHLAGEKVARRKIVKKSPENSI